MSSTNKTSHYNLPQFIGSDIPTWLGDINSAMTAIDSGINAAATSASGAATKAEQASTDAAAAASSATSAYNAAAAAQKSADDALTNAAAAQKSADDALNAVNRCPFPVGFGGFFQTDPSTIYAGTTWEQKKDVFILASGTTYPAGSTGGEAQHMLTLQELPNYVWHCDGSLAGGQKDYFEPVNYQAHGINTLQTDMNQPHNNMPPYFAMPFWIRTA